MHNYLKKNQTTEDSHSTLYFKLPTAYCKFYPFPPRHSCSGSREIMGCNWRRRCTLVLSKNTIVPRRTLASDVCCLLLKASSKGLLMLFKTHLWAGGRCRQGWTTRVLWPCAWQGFCSALLLAERALGLSCSGSAAASMLPWKAPFSWESLFSPLQNCISVEISSSDSF